MAIRRVADPDHEVPAGHVHFYICGTLHGRERVAHIEGQIESVAAVRVPVAVASESVDLGLEPPRGEVTDLASALPLCDSGDR